MSNHIVLSNSDFNITNLKLTTVDVENLHIVIKTKHKLIAATLVKDFVNYLKKSKLCAHVKTLRITGAGLSNFPDVSIFKNLEGLNLRRNKLTRFPNGIMELENLRWIDFSHNNISSVPRGITQLPNLKIIRLENNKLKYTLDEAGCYNFLYCFSVKAREGILSGINTSYTLCVEILTDILICNGYDNSPDLLKKYLKTNPKNEFFTPNDEIIRLTRLFKKLGMILIDTDKESEYSRLNDDDESAMDDRLVKEAMQRYREMETEHGVVFSKGKNYKETLKKYNKIVKPIRSEILVKIAADLDEAESLIKPDFKQYENLEDNKAKAKAIVTAIVEAELKKHPLRKIKDFIRQHEPKSAGEKNKLIVGDSAALAKAREVFTSNEFASQIAWRAFDPDSPTTQWPNLLTPAKVDGKAQVYCPSSVNSTGLSTDGACKMVIEMAACMFKVAKKARNIDIFINMVSEIQRAHNENTSEVDDPSCLPGCITRLDVVAKYALGERKIDKVALINQLIDRVVIQSFKIYVTDKDDKFDLDKAEELFDALQLNRHSILKNMELLSKNKFYNKKLLRIRESFYREYLLNGDDINLFKGVLHEQIKKIEPAIEELTDADQAYINYRLANISHNFLLRKISFIISENTAKQQNLVKSVGITKSEAIQRAVSLHMSRLRQNYIVKERKIPSNLDLILYCEKHQLLNYSEIINLANKNLAEAQVLTETDINERTILNCSADVDKYLSEIIYDSRDSIISHHNEKLIMLIKNNAIKWFDSFDDELVINVFVRKDLLHLCSLLMQQDDFELDLILNSKNIMPLTTLDEEFIVQQIKAGKVDVIHHKSALQHFFIEILKNKRVCYISVLELIVESKLTAVNKLSGYHDGKIKFNKAANENLLRLMLWAYANEKNEIKLALAKHSNIFNEANENGDIALFLAAYYGQTEIVKELLIYTDIEFDSLYLIDRPALIIAAQTGIVEVVSTLLNSKPCDVNIKDDEGYTTPLIEAARNGHIGVVELLLKHEAKINQPNIFGNTALSIAVIKGEYEIIELLTSQADIDVNHINDRGNTPLHLAVDPEKIEAVRILAKHPKVDFNIRNNDGDTVMGIAARENASGDIVKLLLKKDVKIHDVDKFGHTALVLAASHAGFEVVVKLLRHDNKLVKLSEAYIFTNILAACRYNKIAELRRLRDNIEFKNSISDGILKMLIWANKNEQTAMSQILIKSQSVMQDKHAKNGDIALIVAAFNGHIEIVTELLKYNNKKFYVNFEAEPPLLFAAMHGYISVVELLLEHKDIDINKADFNGETALTCAAGCGELEVVRLLLKHKAKINQSNRYNLTALSHAAIAGEYKIIELLTSQTDIDVNHVDIMGNTPLHIAVSKFEIEAVRILASHPKIDFNIRNNNGYTVMGIAARDNYESDIVKLLLEKGANSYDIDKFGYTALILAATRRNFHVVKELLRHDNTQFKPSEAMTLTTLLSVSRCGIIDMVKPLRYQIEFNIPISNEILKMLILAYKNQQTTVAQLLIKSQGVMQNKHAKNGDIALIVAAFNGHIEIVKELLKYNNKEFDANFEVDFAPLLFAAKQGMTEVVQALIDSGEDVNQVNADKKTALMFAAAYGHAEVVSLLLKRPDIDISMLDKDGFSVLVHAIQSKSFAITKELLDTSDDIIICNSKREAFLCKTVSIDMLYRKWSNHEDIVTCYSRICIISDAIEWFRTVSSRTRMCFDS